MPFNNRLIEQLAEKDRQIALMQKQLAEKDRQLTLLQEELTKPVRPENIIWVFGSPRGGTTWLSEMIAAPKRRKLWREPFFGVVLALRRLIVNQSHVSSRQFILSDQLREAWLPSIRNLFLDVAAARYPNPRLLIVVKEPNGSMGAPLIMEALPESKLIFIVRDPRDVVASQLDASRVGSWYGRREYEASLFDTGEGDYVEQLARGYVLNVSGAKEAYESHKGPKAMVRYEDLREDTFALLGRIHDDLDLRLPAAQLRASIAENSWENIPEEERGEGKRRRKATPGSWREDLTPQQAETVERITAPLLNEFYPQ
jgi:Sulfotransferase family